MKCNKLNLKRLLGLRLLPAVLFLLFAGMVQSQAVAPFITTWQTDGSNRIIIPLAGGGYDFSIDWGDAVVEAKTGSPGNITHTYTTAGIYTVTITPNTATGFPMIFLNNFQNRNLLKTITQWGGARWSSMQRAFLGATQLIITATDAPDLLLVTDFTYMFQDCTALTGGAGISDWRFTTDVTKSLNMTSMFQSTSAFNSDISSWNVERVVNMSYMFNSAQAFNQDISGWDVSHVTNMAGMFYNTKVFNQALSGWDVSAVTSMNSMFNLAQAFNSPLLWGATTANVQDMGYMFYNTQAFNQDISGWDVSKVTSMDNMFAYAKVFNQPLAWGVKTGSVTNMNSMFREAPTFNGNISGWDVSNVTSANLMFYRANSFNQDMNSWKLTSLTNATQMFQDNASFNGDISGWTFTTDPAKSVDMNSMFQSTTAFNRDISSWNVARVTNMSNMFNNAQAFNQDLSAWDVSGVTNMTSMFQSTLVFNQPLAWGSKMIKVTNMSYMFNSAQAFNQDISGWDVSHVTNMSGMFYNTKVFNKDLSGWNVTAVTSMNSMFNGAQAFNSSLLWGATTANVQDMGYMFYNTQAFNQNISGWDVSKVTNMDNMFAYAKVFNSPLLWGAKTGSVTSMNGMFREAPAFNQNIDGWDVSNVTSANLMFYRANSFNQDMNSWKLTSLTNATQMFLENTSFNGDISGWTFTTDPAKSVDMNSMFQSTTVFNRDISSWNVGRVTNMSNMFNNAQAFNQDISAWDVSGVTNMTSMFQSTLVFNQPLAWGAKTVSVTNMSYMFNSAQAFNQDISGWDVSHVTNMAGMFYNTKVFNKDLSGWDVSAVTSMNSMFNLAQAFNSPLLWGAKTANVQDMSYMFYNTQAFNQDISGWDISKVTNANNFMYGKRLARINYDSLLLGWSVLVTGETQVPANLNVHFGTSKYSNDPDVIAARAYLTGTKHWVITDGGMQTDTDGPVITGSLLALNDSTIKITFNERVYNSYTALSNLDSADFSFSLSGGTATLSSATPISIFTTDNINFTLGIGLIGVPDGAETITVSPVANSIYDLAENVAGITQSNNTALLHDLRYPAISAQPSTDSQAICKNGTAAPLSVTATGIEALSYQWYSNTTASNNGGIAISGANNNSFTPPASSEGTTWYYVEVSMSTGTIASDVSGPIMVDALPVVSISPDNASIHLGDSITLTASGANTYLWGIDNTNPLDHVSACKLAVGLRRLSSSYNGPALRIRRADDNAEASFGFAGNELDLNAINTFLGASAGYCTTLFDQSGAGSNVVQTNPSQQPLFVATGLNGKPTLHFSSGRFMTNSTNFPAPFSVIYTATQTGPARGRVLAGLNNNWLLGWWSGNKTQAYFDGWVSPAGGSAADSNPYVYSGTGTGTISSIYENGTLAYSDGGGRTGPNGININGQESSDADVAELFVFNAVLADADRELVENSSGSYYGIFGEVFTPGAARVVSPAISTSYSVTGYSANKGCSVAKTTLVTVLNDPGLANFPDQDRLYFDGSYAITPPSSNSAGTFTYTSSNTAVATISGNTVTIVGPGLSTIMAVQASTPAYFSDSIAATLNITSVTVVTKNGELSSTSPNYVDKNGALSLGSGLNSNGKSIVAKGSGNGLTAATASSSAYQIKLDYPSSGDGFYWIKNPNINGGAPFQIYADMTTDGGGWTLIMCNGANSGWTYVNAISRDSTTPSINSNYSIIGWADYIKKSASGFQYMIDANTRKSNGGIWTANGAYTFLKGDNIQTDITLNTKFGTWSYNDSGIEERMPWYSNCAGTITTSNSCNGAWWGTLVSTNGFNPAPWIGGGCGTEGCMTDPGIIWYWVR